MNDTPNDVPRFTGTMGVIRWIIFGAMALFALVMVASYFGVTPWAAESAPETLYHCPMHPTYVSNKPGDCPICGMSLVPVSEQQGAGGMGGAGATQPAVHASEVSGLVEVTIDPRRIQMIGLKTGVVEKRSIDADTRTVGYVAVDETRAASLNVRTSGWVRKLYVNQTGQPVAKGQPLLSLYSQDLYSAQQDLLVALASRKKVNADEALATTRERLLDASRDRLRLLGMSDEDIARVEETGQASSDLTLRSPFSGVVLDKAVLEGQFVTPDQALFQIADLSTIWVLADVYERDIARFAVGNPARMSVAAFPGERFDGRVAFLYPSVSETTRTLKVRLEFANPAMRLRPGMYAEIEFPGGGSEVAAVPVDAVMDGGETQYAFVVHNGVHFEPRVVRTGRRSNDWVEIVSGVALGDTIVTSANFLIDSESRLKAAIAGMTGAPDTGGHGGGHTH
jgi:Cu(I)/Ag(I) efflux system membrane fusion protein